GARRDELAQAQLAEQISANNLRIYLNFDESKRLSVEELKTDVPDPAELAEFTVGSVKQHPELVQFDYQKRVAEEDRKIARAERRPQVSYALEAGTVSDSLRPNRIGRSAGFRGTVSVNFPLLDWGASKSRQTRAELREKIAESSRLFAERQFIADFNSNLYAADAAETRIRNLAKILTDSEKVLDVVIDRYKAGETQILEVTDTQNVIVNRRLELLRAIFDFQIAKARLRQVTGR
ncbi:MAG: TolC family protein, partial [Acidobacteria bacterium]|nr:TolC family protein [Acidobacteriota bacterium]